MKRRESAVLWGYGVALAFSLLSFAALYALLPH